MRIDFITQWTITLGAAVVLLVVAWALHFVDRHQSRKRPHGSTSDYTSPRL